MGWTYGSPASRPSEPPAEGVSLVCDSGVLQQVTWTVFAARALRLRCRAAWPTPRHGRPYSMVPVPSCWPFATFPYELWRQIWINDPHERLNTAPLPYRRGRHLPQPDRHHPPGRAGLPSRPPDKGGHQRRCLGRGLLANIRWAIIDSRLETVPFVRGNLAAVAQSRLTVAMTFVRMLQSRPNSSLKTQTYCVRIIDEPPG